MIVNGILKYVNYKQRILNFFLQSVLGVRDGFIKIFVTTQNEGMVIPREWLNSQRFYDLIHIVYMLELIDQSTLRNMIDMNKIRNRVVHPINVKPNQDFPTDKEIKEATFKAAIYNEVLIKQKKAMNEEDEKRA